VMVEKILLVFSLTSSFCFALRPFTPCSSLSCFEELQDRINYVMNYPDPVIRNLMISQTYHDLSLSLKMLLGDRGGNFTQGSWPTIASWVSNTVGVAIRKQLLPFLVEEMLPHAPLWLQDLLEIVPEALDILIPSILNSSSEYLAGGNNIVFKQIGVAHSMFGVYFANLTERNETRLQSYLKTFNQNDPVVGYLQQAMTYLYEAMFTDDYDSKAQFFLIYGLLGTLAEQIRVQSYLKGAIPSNVTINLPIFGEVKIPEDVTAYIFTSYMETLVLANEILWVGEDMPLRPWDGQMWSQGLDKLTLPVLDNLYISFVGQDTSLLGTAASDWLDLNQRMRYVCALFRTRNSDPYLDCPIFSMEVQEQFWAGNSPDYTKFCFGNCYSSL